jgi:hypothetical protein
MAAERTRVWTHVGLCALYVPLVVWSTWPVAWHAADHVVDGVRQHGNFGWLALADTLLMSWVMAWDVHALGTNPAGLLDANIFHPARWALARSEHALGTLPLFAPVYLATGNPILAQQLAMVATYVLAAVAAYVLVWRWVERPLPAFVAGALFGLTPSQLAGLSQIQVLPTMWLPVVLLATVEVLRGRRLGWTVGLGLALVMQSLCSPYLGAMAFVTAAAAAAGFWLATRDLDRRRLVRLAAAVGAAAMLTVVAYLPQAILGRSGEIPRPSMALQEGFSARPLASYLPGLGIPGIAAPFLSIPAVALLVLALALPRRLVRAPAGARAAAIAVGVAGWVLSLGPTLRPGDGVALPLPYRLLAFVPGLGALRAPSRFGVLVALAAAILAGLALAALRPATRRIATVAAVAILLGANRLTFPLRPIETGGDVPPVYRWLAEHGGGGPVLELPVGADAGNVSVIYGQSRYTYFSTYHWSPLLNGYSGYPPQSFFLVMAIARRLPDRDALQDLVDLTGLRWVVLHLHALDAERRDAWIHGVPEGLTAAAQLEEAVVYRVTLDAKRDRRARLAWPTTEPITLTDVPVAPLGPGDLRGTLRDLTIPPRARPGWALEGWVTIENQSSVAWPGLRAADDGLIHLQTRWQDAAGAPVLTRVPVDLRPGEHARVPFVAHTPAAAGRYHLHLTLAQKAGSTFDEHAGPSADAEVEILP